MSFIQLNQVSFSHTMSNRAVLDNVHYVIHQGDLVILLGSNGSGKSTLLSLLNRQQLPTHGTIQHPPNGTIALLTQDCNQSLFTSLTLYENFLLVNKPMSPDSREFLQRYLLDFNPRLSEKLNSLVSSLSGGEKQAFALALCLLNPPDLLLLDEHTSALDPNTAQQIMALTIGMIQKHNITCLLTTHQLDFAIEYGNRLLMLREGKIVTQLEESAKRALTKEKLRGFYA